MRVPFLDLAAQHAPLAGDILAAWRGVLEAGAFVGGEHVEAFEREFAMACGTRHCVAVGSGTDALRFAFMALGLAPGDEVIVPPMTFIATAEAVTQAGGRPVFADLDPATHTLDPARFEAAITPKTRGVVPVHLYGQPADMEPILDVAGRRGLWVVEDAAQAHLATYRGRMAGSMGHAAAFSFYPGKNLGACGEAGAVTTDDARVAAAVRVLRDHGQATKNVHEREGYNGRCDALQAAALRVKLPRLAAWNAKRAELAVRYGELLAAVPGVDVSTEAEGRSSSWHLYPVFVEHRDRVREFMTRMGVGTGVHYPVPLHLMPPYAHLGHREGDFPVAEDCARRVLTLPLYPEMNEAQVAIVVEALSRAVAAAAR
ncbi:dTDP-4-amino-4,6-dideoxygalactose transaminase [Desulfobaculum xiamenense]|uniref:dTDP-4-amino-4,6-dideoxygalactose transaminase n=1 Tax=Desulfobaculum xiamenense TaxID=995050 RepID=A0A846QUL2_9BACT|nr:DegT/DnrJ/EryC1/StrS family aminotransferase [Desulfobaculum xiamenense]NJB69215.1 dTDP-4-amino-4,6-dideoxygalactose transaminase [Desulfobaculum xiamenense]